MEPPDGSRRNPPPNLGRPPPPVGPLWGPLSFGCGQPAGGPDLSSATKFAHNVGGGVTQPPSKFGAAAPVRCAGIAPTAQRFRPHPCHSTLCCGPNARVYWKHSSLQPNFLVIAPSPENRAAGRNAETAQPQANVWAQPPQIWKVVAPDTPPGSSASLVALLRSGACVGQPQLGKGGAPRPGQRAGLAQPQTGRGTQRPPASTPHQPGAHPRAPVARSRGNELGAVRAASGQIWQVGRPKPGDAT